MRKATHKPPSRIKYDQSHPIVSCRLRKDIHTLLKQRLEDQGVSFADFVKEQLGQQVKMPNIKEIKQKATEEGYEEATQKWQIVYPCAVCGKPIVMTPNSEDHKAMQGFMKQQGWRHGNCPNQ